MGVVKNCDYNTGKASYIETLDGHKIAALLNLDTTLDKRILTAPRGVIYADEMLLAFRHTELADIPQVNIVHEWREGKTACKTIYHRAFLLEIPKQYSIGGGLIVTSDLKYEYELREEIRNDN